MTFIATAEALDEEMAGRIARHRRERPAGWTTVEEPLALREAIGAVDPGSAAIVDCLTLWVSNTLDRDEESVLAEAAASGRAGGDAPGARGRGLERGRARDRPDEP